MAAPAAPSRGNADTRARESTAYAHTLSTERQSKQEILARAQQQAIQEEEERRRRIAELERLNEALQDPSLQEEQRRDIQARLQRYQNEQYNLINSQHLFRVINQKIKELIIYLKNAIYGRGGNLNQVVKNTVESLETMGLSVETFAEMSTRTTEAMRRQKPVSTDIRLSEVQQFINTDDKTTVDGVLSAVGKNINLTNLNTDHSAEDPNRLLATEYETDDATPEQIKNRLINCQYLEILYLTKHDELKKVFEFALHLYDKYTYAIKILLFVLKNLLDRQPCEPPQYPPQYPPGAPPEGQDPREPATPPQIKLPKALITDIKLLLKDQKHVQNVINQMRNVVDREVPNLVNETNANAVGDPILGSTIDEHNPRGQ